jgi:uncharacterized membrane-anchored protein
MKEYRFYIDRKVTIWERDKFKITAKNKKEAIKKAKEEMSFPSYDESYVSETIFESIEDMLVDENKGMATIELYDRETDKLICDNKKGTN